MHARHAALTRSAGSARWLTACLVLALGLGSMPAARAQEITVSAASSLVGPLRELSAAFEAARPGVRVRLNLGASGALLHQIVQGAPVDVLVSADVETLEGGVRAGVLDERSRRDIASNALVLVVPTAEGQALADLSALAQPSVRRIAIGKPDTVPAGRYAQQALRAALLPGGAPLAPAVQGKLVMADNVRQALDYVARGEVDAGFVYRTDATSAGTSVRVAFVVAGHEPIRYPSALVVGSRQPALAREFIQHLASTSAAPVLARHGFGPP